MPLLASSSAGSRVFRTYKSNLRTSEVLLPQFSIANGSPRNGVAPVTLVWGKLWPRARFSVSKTAKTQSAQSLLGVFRPRCDVPVLANVQMMQHVEAISTYRRFLENRMIDDIGTVQPAFASTVRAMCKRETL